MEDRFWSKVDKSGECWEWRAGTDASGYGRIGWDGAVQSAHRVSWQLQKGEIPKGLCVLHRCDNPRCVRPDHLFLGTNADNMRDKVMKGRQARGEKIGLAKLTESDVREIRTRYATGNVSMATLAREYGVKKRAIRKVVRYRTWKHVA